MRCASSDDRRRFESRQRGSPMPPPPLTETSAFPQPPSPGTVSPAARRALQNLPDPGGPEDLQAHRAMCAELQRTLGGAQMARHGVRMEESAIAGVPVRIYAPPERAEHPDGMLLNLHGGGFIVDAGSITENVPVAAYTGVPVISVRYRLAPEHAFPAALDDAERVYRELIAEHGASRLILYGTSAGACLCAQLL